MSYDYEENLVWYKKGPVETSLPEELQMKQEEKFYVNIETLKSIVDFLEMFTEFENKNN